MSTIDDTLAAGPQTPTEFALQYAAAGLSVVPIACDGSKKPPLGQAWKHLQNEIAAHGEIRRMWRGDKGIAVIGGRVSGNLEVLDIDDATLVEAFEAAVEAEEPGLLAKLCTVATPRDNGGGRHYRYRLRSAVAGNTKLAQSELRPQYKNGEPEIDLKTGEQRMAPETLIETRGEGGYAIVPGSPATCHPSNLPYRHTAGPPLTDIQVITDEEHATLWRIAQRFNRYVEQKSVTDAPKQKGNKQSPGNAYNEAIDWNDLLGPAGWTVDHVAGDLTFWCRPGKDSGVSATTGVRSSNGTELFCVFSSNAHPFEGATNGRPCTSYSKFAAFTVLNHGGDYSAAAKDLVDRGYGDDGDDQGDGDDADDADSPTPKKSAATALVDEVLKGGTELWHTPGGDTFATVQIGDHIEHLPVRSRAFRRWLSHLCYGLTQKAPTSQVIADAIGVLDGKAAFDGSEHTIHLRVAEFDGAIYLDLCNPKWHVVEITALGWQIVANPPVRFRRAKAMLPLAEPVRGGHIRELRRFINVSDDDWVLVVAWLVAALRATGPFAVLVLHGEQGSAKSTTQRLLRTLTDPNEAPLRSEPREARDLMIAANNGWVVSLDNLSYLPPWLSDALCRLSTGGGFSTRALYENDEEMIFTAMRPIILNGIEEVATRSDLLDRSMLVSLQLIPENQRRSEAQIWREFAAAKPRILGGLLDAVVVALRELPHTRPQQLPRMADFAIWAVAAETGLGLKKGEFLRVFSGNRASANELALESSPIFGYIRDLLDQCSGDWSGTASELLRELDELASEKDKRSKSWPSAPHVLSGKIIRVAPNLRLAGIEVELKRDKKQRYIALCRVPENSVTAVTSVIDAENTAKYGDAPGDGGDDEASPRVPQASPDTHVDPEENASGDAGDADDAVLPTPSTTRVRV